jgi:hypothetical protein
VNDWADLNLKVCAAGHVEHHSDVAFAHGSAMLPWRAMNLYQITILKWVGYLPLNSTTVRTNLTLS